MMFEMYPVLLHVDINIVCIFLWFFPLICNWRILGHKWDSAAESAPCTISPSANTWPSSNVIILYDKSFFLYGKTCGHFSRLKMTRGCTNPLIYVSTYVCTV